MMEFLYTHGAVIGLLFFFTVFVWVFVSTYRPGQKNVMQSHAAIPLREESNHE